MTTTSDHTIPVHATARATAIAFDGVSRRFGDTLALDDVALGIASGETVALLRPNGAGKTTAIGIMLGLLEPPRVAPDPRPGTARRDRFRQGRRHARVGGPPPGARVGELVDLARGLYPNPSPRAAILERAGLGDGLGYSPRARSTSSPTRAPGGEPRGLEHRPDAARPDGVVRGHAQRGGPDPLDGSSSPSMMPIAVVLPAPLGPSRATVSPAAMATLTSSRARVSPKRRLTPSKSTAVTRDWMGMESSSWSSWAEHRRATSPREVTVVAIAP